MYGDVNIWVHFQSTLLFYFVLLTIDNVIAKLVFDELQRGYR